MEIFVTDARTEEQAVRMNNPDIADRTYPATAARLLAQVSRID
jgi:hypothetical protein